MEHRPFAGGATRTGTSSPGSVPTKVTEGRRPGRHGRVGGRPQPDPCELTRRKVAIEGCVCYETNLYSVPEPWIGDPVELRSKGLPTLALRRLLRMIRDYPETTLLEAVATAQHSGLFDLNRLENMVLRNIASGFFRLDGDPP